ncbi:hypothetical protein GWK47_055069 [Chionoecetes opilio]|uniref:Uncharacterized protein n=1 Tax=Chionoecetes opilio TaxID=41210 RepID=A0A8J5CPI0_CHIOP|nr:hypothetical protein GWK47_055069 [Chionoecetes opilio]
MPTLPAVNKPFSPVSDPSLGGGGRHQQEDAATDEICFMSHGVLFRRGLRIVTRVSAALEPMAEWLGLSVTGVWLAGLAVRNEATDMGQWSLLPCLFVHCLVWR